MRFLLTCVLLFAFGIANSQENQVLSDTNELKWQKRLILVFGNEENSKVLPDLESYNYGIIDRDVLWFVINEDGIRSNFDGLISEMLPLIAKNRFLPLENTVLVIGKDGNVITRNPFFNLPYIFDSIDKLPMRKFELNNRV